MRYAPLFFLLLLSSCSFLNKELPWNDYVKYIQAEENGLVVKKYVNHLELSMKYLPAEYLVHSELKNDTSFSAQERDSMVKVYDQNLTFVLSINPDERDGESPIEDVLFYGLKQKEEYKNRMMYLNFDIKDYVTLTCDSLSEYVPVIVNMENNYGLSKGRNITLVFTPLKSKDEFRKSKNITLEWNDEVFETGHHYFPFQSEALFSIPSLKL